MPCTDTFTPVGLRDLLTADWLGVLGTWFVGGAAAWLAHRANKIARTMKRIEKRRVESAERSSAMTLVHEMVMARQHLHVLRLALEEAAPRINAVSLAGLIGAYRSLGQVFGDSVSSDLIFSLKPKLAAEVSRHHISAVGLANRVGGLVKQMESRALTNAPLNSGEAQSLFQMARGHIATINEMEREMLDAIRALWAINHPKEPVPEVVVSFGAAPLGVPDDE